jgi:tetratricopeptide (TPR) repeat protein
VAYLIESLAFWRLIAASITWNTVMSLFNRLRPLALLGSGALLLCFSLSARADDVQDAQKLFKQKQYDQALDKVESILASKPKDIQARFLKGVILIEKGKTEDAIGIFQALTEDAPDRPEPYNNLGLLYALQGQYDKAKASVEMAIHIQPTYALAHENLGEIYAKMASKEYERALQLDPNNSALQAKLATVRQLFPKSSARAQTVTIPAAASTPAAATPAKP